MQSNPVNTGTDEAIESVLINSVSVLSRSCYSSKTAKKSLILEKIQIKEMKEGISIVKLSISNLHKTIIPRIKHTETFKNLSSINL